ncbi:acetylajmalan esterase-like isoform X1 [Nicotiana tomentosiformis]|uniref:acetylajmalan esterase-like isoform X1 n=1 Tax=Nicotiana tomentosiformis TaxID=4098 RepID=UPI00388C5D07
MALAIRVLDLLRVLSIVSFLVLLQFLQKTDAQVLIPQVPTLMKCKFDKIYQLGDSLSDTGNFIRESLVGAFSPFAKLPYGENFFQNKSTGRCSDGLLMIDFIALECGLPFLNPYKDQNGNFTHGANFAVAGATVLPECSEDLKKALFLVGEIGGNELFRPLSMLLKYAFHFLCF